jgi:dipeptidyl aminopeptidase/acylaminoacyl peptidase
MVYAQPGHVLYVQEGALLAQTFDLGSLRLTGEPVRIAEGLDYYRSTGSAAFSVSDFGGLAYHGNPGALELSWFDRQGKALAPVGGRQKFGNLRISPEGERAAVEVVEPRLGTSDIWIYQLSRGIPIRLTTDLNDEQYPAWSPDGRRIMFGSDRGTGVDASSDFFAKSSDGMGDEETVFVHVGPQFLEDWSRDGRFAAYRDGTRETGADLWILPLDGDRKPWPFVRSRFEEWGSRFSPDSAWLAFVSDDSGTSEVYLAPLRGSGAKTRVSTGGGVSPRWRRDGRELFYLSGDGRTVMSVPIDLTPTLRVGTPVRLFTTAAEAGFRGNARDRAYDVTPDGTRFLFSVSADQTASSRITVVLDWPALLRR